MKLTLKSAGILAVVVCLLSSVNGAELRLSRYFSDNMVLQREKPVKVWGTADPGTRLTVTFGDQETTATADKDGKWVAALAPMKAAAKGRDLKVTSADASVGLENILVGDVWLFGRQTYVDISLGRSAEGRTAAANYKPAAQFRAVIIKTLPAKKPQNDLSADATAGWMQVDRKNALKMSAAAFYLGAALPADMDVPVGIIDVNMSHYFGIGWLSQKMIADAATIHPDDKEIDWLPKWMKEQAEERDSGKAAEDLEAYYQEQLERAKRRGKPVHKPSLGLHPLQNPMYPSAGYNAVIHPLKNLSMKGILLQLGNDYPFIAYRELDKQGKSTLKIELDAAWGDNYAILKNGYRVTPVTLPYVPADWRRAFGDEDLPIGLILPPASDLDVYAAHNREIRELHRRTSEQLKGVGLVLPGNENIPSSGQPADDQLLAERCRHWVLGAVNGKADITASGPLFDRVESKISKARVYFKQGSADGLKAVGDALDHFETAGPDRVFTPAKARIDGSTIKLISEGPIQFVRYNWNEKPDQGLVNGAGLPALPFNTDADWQFSWIPPPETPNLPEEYNTTADKWGKSNVAIINGQIANLPTGDSEPIPRRPGPLGIYTSPFGPNIYVISIDQGSPADGKVEPGDVIYGVNGKVFDDGAGVPADAQYHVLSEAITYSETEAGQGKLVLSLRRGSEIMDVDLQLKVLGSYSSSTPYYCEKSQNIVENAEAWISKRYRPEEGLPSETTGKLNTDLLFMLASGNPELQGLVRRAVYGKMEHMNPEPVVPGMQSKPWNSGHDSLLLGEYFQTTGDRNVLPYLKYQADLSAGSQLKPPADTPPGKEAAQSEEQVGGWRHNYPGNPERWKSGYGLLPHAGMACVMGMQLAQEAGLDIDEVALERGLVHFHKGRAEHGFVLYSYSNLRREGPPPIRPEAEAEGKLWSMNGKLGMAASLYNMVGKEGAVGICSRFCVYGYNNTRHGHGGMFFNNFWTPIGAWVSGDRGFKHFMKNQIWWRELFRRHDGSFNQVGRGGIGVAYALPYVAPKQRLRILGAPKTAFGTNCPDYLKPAVAAHRKRDYALCESLIREQMKKALPAEEMPIVTDLLESVRILRASLEHDLNLTEKLIADGKYYYASLELPQLEGVLAADNPRLKEIQATLKSADGVARVAAHRKACDQAEKARKAALAAAKPRSGKEHWIDLTPEDRWQMKVVETIAHAPKGWMLPEFDDITWNQAKLPISWTMYHTALFRTSFQLEDPAEITALRVSGRFFQQANVVVYLNGKLVAKIDNIGRGTRETLAPLTDYGLAQLKQGQNTIAISSRHKRRWGPYRGKYKTAATVDFAFKAKK